MPRFWSDLCDMPICVGVSEELVSFSWWPPPMPRLEAGASFRNTPPSTLNLSTRTEICWFDSRKRSLERLSTVDRHTVNCTGISELECWLFVCVYYYFFVWLLREGWKDEIIAQISEWLPYSSFWIIRWCFDEVTIRFSCTIMSSISNRFSHNINNCINKYTKFFLSNNVHIIQLIFCIKARKIDSHLWKYKKSVWKNLPGSLAGFCGYIINRHVHEPARAGLSFRHTGSS